MTYKIVSTCKLIEKSSYFKELKKNFKIERKETIEKDWKGNKYLLNTNYIEIDNLSDLKKIQEITECPITLYKGTIAIEDFEYCDTSLEEVN